MKEIVFHDLWNLCWRINKIENSGGWYIIVYYYYYSNHWRRPEAAIIYNKVPGIDYLKKGFCCREKRSKHHGNDDEDVVVPCLYCDKPYPFTTHER